MDGFEGFGCAVTEKLILLISTGSSSDGRGRECYLFVLAATAALGKEDWGPSEGVKGLWEMRELSARPLGAEL